MKMVLLTLALMSQGAFADTNFSLNCSLNRASVTEHEKVCPKMIEDTLANMGCGGIVTSCTRVSPGASSSSLKCKVSFSQCTEPQKQATSSYATCGRAQRLNFKDFDYTNDYKSPISSDVNEGMASKAGFLCLVRSNH